MFTKRTVKDIPVHNQTVLLRVDFNLPLNDDGSINDDYRIKKALPTIKYLLDQNCKIVICSHLGRPKSKSDVRFSMQQVATRLAELIDAKVAFVNDCIGDKVKQTVKNTPNGQIVLLENLRFYEEEKANDSDFAKNLAQSTGAQYFVQDGFGVVHRAHASTEAITHYLPSVAGLLLEAEVGTITQAMVSPKKPLVAVLGGAKISDKINVIERFIDIADQIIIGGAMANTFLKYKGLPIGKSVHESDLESVISAIYAKAAKKVGDQKVEGFLLLPTDVIVATGIEQNAHGQAINVTDVPDDQYILDIGPKSTDTMLAKVKDAGTVIWNGTLGYTEIDEFAKGSAALAQNLADAKGTTFSLIGGGDTASYVIDWAKDHGGQFDHVSTGGGASLDLMSGKTLPGVDSLLDR